MGAEGTRVVTAERLLQADRLLVVGLAEQARTIYREVLAAEPNNARAIVALANCEIELGNDRAAYDLAVRALGIDRSNDVARRMEARLAEVMTMRGQRVQRPGWIGR
jgi:thioredoxin-like negative regulator of GroEL